MSLLTIKQEHINHPKLKVLSAYINTIKRLIFETNCFIAIVDTSFYTQNHRTKIQKGRRKGGNIVYIIYDHHFYVAQHLLHFQ